MKLHIGCGDRKLDGYTSVDIRPEVKPDILDDVMLKGKHFPDCEEIYACMVLEHLPRERVLSVLQRWREIVDIGGMVRISVPNFRAAAAYYMKMEPPAVDCIQGLLMGREDHERNFHHSLWDATKLEGMLIRAGFREVRDWNWRAVHYGKFDDYASAYLPDFCKQTGTLMALNMFGVK